MTLYNLLPLSLDGTCEMRNHFCDSATLYGKRNFEEVIIVPNSGWA